MKLVIFGATGKTGIELINQALEQGHKVTAFLRDPAKLTIDHAQLNKVKGDAFDAENVAEAIAGQDAVLCALGSGQDLKKTNVRATGTSNIIAGMEKKNVKRLLLVTAMGVGESWDDLSAFNKLFFATLLKSSREDHEAQEAVVKSSTVDWTIVRPSGLTDTTRTGEYDFGERIKAKTSKISRADVADLILKEVVNNKLIGKAVTITN